MLRAFREGQRFNERKCARDKRVIRNAEEELGIPSVVSGAEGEDLSSQRKNVL